jgi:hypothetical protein
MNTTLRNILAGVAGFVAGSIAMMLLEMVGHERFPLPPGIDPNDPASLATNLDRIPTPAFAMVVLAWFVGPLVGVAVAGTIAPAARLRLAQVLGAVYLCAGVFNLVMIPGPVWMWPAGLGALAFGSFVGWTIADQRAARAAG